MENQAIFSVFKYLYRICGQFSGLTWAYFNRNNSSGHAIKIIRIQENEIQDNKKRRQKIKEKRQKALFIHAMNKL
jgi:hypothetical protein